MSPYGFQVWAVQPAMSAHGGKPNNHGNGRRHMQLAEF